MGEGGGKAWLVRMIVPTGSYLDAALLDRVDHPKRPPAQPIGLHFGVGDSDLAQALFEFRVVAGDLPEVHVRADVGLRLEDALARERGFLIAHAVGEREGMVDVEV